MEFTHKRFTNVMNGIFNREVNANIEEIRDGMSRYREMRESYEAFVPFLRNYILDPSMTFLQKASDAADEEFESEEEALAFFRIVWEVTTDGQPFPLDEAKAKKK